MNRERLYRLAHEAVKRALGDMTAAQSASLGAHESFPAFLKSQLAAFSLEFKDLLPDGLVVEVDG
ncbi:MAG: hypothetical protein D6743_11165, partial [Calditrichaeota bacterium]